MKVLSIQSHVVFGYVGNKCAVAPLHILGHEVDSINTVQFSFHTGYGNSSGSVTSAHEMKEILNSLVENALTQRYTHIITGYVKSPECLIEIADFIKITRFKNPKTKYILDPVIGDNGIMYVDKENIPVYTNSLLKLADIITPNQYEAEWLSNKKIDKAADGFDVLKYFFAEYLNLNIAIITSIDEGEYLTLVAGEKSADGTYLVLMLLGATIYYKIRMEKYQSSFTGTGDLFVALFSAYLEQYKFLKEALEATISVMQFILQTTEKEGRWLANNDNVELRSLSFKDSRKYLELQIMKAKKMIENPEMRYRAEILEL
ncbi:Ribokinase-like protein [Rozella allomycis CSF55]|uniref:pyridoxal kinase n=1 Tax=Rozella allomycis (strain CSF55) TaxID=988480 RepID=A0A075B4S4_ROZAC|nr:Pyridoxal phosphate biosynthesis domain-containing protein [Rozella allomycis CSF55]RKP22082.1 Ribokinase-like protein [Rozella allomycis CSF55]|eukprot:EPZ36439.1 Pyridoxal phosphate biosynthesis domain-containing protein [Rozella allomycis CSF55]